MEGTLGKHSGMCSVDQGDNDNYYVNFQVDLNHYCTMYIWQMLKLYLKSPLHVGWGKYW